MKLLKDVWKEIMNKYLEKAWLEQFDKDLSVLKTLDWVVYNKEDRLNLLEQIGNFSINPSTIIKRILKFKNLLPSRKTWNKDLIDNEKQKNKDNWKKALIIWWEENLPYKLWHCCRRIIPKEIVAHINWKWIITIHKRNCNVLDDVNKERLLSAHLEWTNEEAIIVDVELVFRNQIWVLKELSDIIYSMWIDIDYIGTTNIWRAKTKFNLKLMVLDYDYLVIDRFIERLKLKFDKLLYSAEILKVKKTEE